MLKFLLGSSNMKPVYHNRINHGKNKDGGKPKIVNLHGKTERNFVNLPLTKEEGCDKIPE